MRYKTVILGMLMFAVVASLYAGKSVKNSYPQLDIATYGNSPLVVCRYRPPRIKADSRYLTFDCQQLQFTMPQLPKKVDKSHNTKRPSSLKNGTIHPLYPILKIERLGDHVGLEVLFLLPRPAVALLHQNSGHIKAEYRPALRHYWHKIFSSSSVVGNILTDKVSSEALQRQWRESFQAQLTKQLEEYEDTALESLLYMRFFDTVPQLRPQNWKSSPLAKIFFTLCGFNDVRDAIPLNRHRQPLLEPITHQAPKPLQLPAVKVAPATALPDSLAHWVPRSCYYVEWPTLAACESALARLAKLLDRWSADTFPRLIAQTIKDYRQQLGLTKKYFTDNFKSGSVKIAIAGWDPYFQSGTSLLVVIKSSQPAAALPQAPYVSRPQKNIVVVANSAKLYRMALQADRKGRSLGQMNNFLYSRQRLKCQSGEKEQLFLYISDYWLINFLSPRWQIISNRLARLDNRLRLVSLLKLCHYYEQFPRSAKPVTLKMLRQDPYLKAEFKEWLLNGLTERQGVVMDRKLGALYHHLPVDQIPFKLVTKSEYEGYNDFKRLYRRRWQRIDPIALQIVKSGDELYKTRLYVSPLSNRSSFRSLRNFVAKKKPLHSFSLMTGQAVKLSIAVPTLPLRAFGIRAPLPLTVFLQLTLFDCASSSYSPVSWLEPERPYDSSAYMRLPLAVTIPSVVINSLGMIRAQSDFAPSPYRDITMMRRMFDIFYPIMRFDGKNGLSYFSFDPTTLERIRDERKVKMVTDTVPCDIRLAVDLINGYQLRHKMWFEALKNRALASWRRYNRRLRIGGFFSTQPDKLPAEFNIEHIFADKAMVVSDSLVRRLPPLRHLPVTARYRYGSNILSEAKNLPELLRFLTALDFFISVEPDAVMFETHYRFKYPTTPVQGRETARTGQNQNKNSAPQLDFDEQ